MLCPHLNHCPMFQMFQSKGLLKIWLRRYCESENHVKCARYSLSLLGQSIPRNLLPNGQSLKGIGSDHVGLEIDVLPTARSRR